MTAFASIPVVAEATHIGAQSTNRDVHDSDPQCPLHVDSSRLLCANTGDSLGCFRSISPDK